MQSSPYTPLLSHVAYKLFVYMLHPSCDVVNHKNVTARVNVTGSIRVNPGSNPGSNPSRGARVKGGIVFLKHLI